MVRHERVGEERVHDRRRVGDSGRLDDDAPEGGDLARVRAVEQVAQLVGQVAAQRAADAAAREQHRPLVDAAQEVMVEADLAELVDDHRRLGELGPAQQLRDERRLAAPEEAGDERDRPLHEASDASSAGSSGIERAAREALGLDPQRGEVADESRPALAVAEHVHAGRPGVDGQAVVPQHAAESACAEDARPAVVTLVGPVLLVHDAAQRAH